MLGRRSFLGIIGLRALFSAASTQDGAVIQSTGKSTLSMPALPGSSIMTGWVRGVAWSLQVGDEVLLKRRPDNRYDESAIEVHSTSGHKLGYLPRSDNTVLALKMNRPAEAAEYLSSITERECALDRPISKAGICVAVRLPVSDEVSTEVNPDLRRVLLALSQAYLKQKRWQDALVCLQRLRHIEPYNTATKLAMAEWHLKARPGDRQAFVEVVGLAEGIEGESEVGAALLLDKTKALRGLGRIAEALTTSVA